MSTDPAFLKLQEILMRQGTHRMSDPAEVYNAVVIVEGMKKSGHAILLDEVFDDKQRFVEAHVLHYKGCRACNLKEEGKDVQQR